MWSTSLSVSELLPWIVAGVWLIQLAFVISGSRYRQVLGTSGRSDRSGMPTLSVLVAARNEEDCIENCLRSLCMQDYPDLEVIAVNDRSTDGTAAILNRLEREFDGRLRVIHITSLPSGWFGKSHALHTGMQFAKGDWICFTDADCEQTCPQSLLLSMNEASRRGVEMLTLTPQFTVDSVWEKITLPVCSFLMMIWFQPRHVNNPRSPISYANGAFILISRRSYDLIGGWTSVRNQICEDHALSKTLKAAGVKIAMVQNDGLYRARMYTSARSSWNGWSRIFYGCLSKSIITLSALRIIAISIIPTWVFVYSLVAMLLSSKPVTPSEYFALSGWAAVVACQQIQAAIAFRLVGTPIRWSLTIHAGHLIMIGMLSRALLNHFGMGSLQWRGTVYQQGKIVTPVPAIVKSHPRRNTVRPVIVSEQNRFAPGVDQFVNRLNDVT